MMINLRKIIILFAISFVFNNNVFGKDKLLSYQSVYDIKLGESKVNKALGKTYVTQASGELFIDWIDNCESWVSNQRMVTRFINSSSVGTVSEINYSLVESNDGKKLDFSLEVKENTNIVEQTFGKAEKKDELIVKFDFPVDRQSLKFENDVIFPHQFLEHVIKNFTGKEKIIMKKVYEGTIPDKYFQISVFFTGETSKESKKLLPKGVKNEFQKVRMAYYQDKTQTPILELTAHINDQGIGSFFKYDYPEYSLIMNLKKLSLVKLACTDM